MSVQHTTDQRRHVVARDEGIGVDWVKFRVPIRPETPEERRERIRQNIPVLPTEVLDEERRLFGRHLDDDERTFSLSWWGRRPA